MLYLIFYIFIGYFRYIKVKFVVSSQYIYC